MIIIIRKVTNVKLSLWVPCATQWQDNHIQWSPAGCNCLPPATNISVLCVLKGLLVLVTGGVWHSVQPGSDRLVLHQRGVTQSHQAVWLHGTAAATPSAAAPTTPYRLWHRGDSPGHVLIGRPRGRRGSFLTRTFNLSRCHDGLLLIYTAILGGAFLHCFVCCS